MQPVRRCIVVRGDRDATRREADELSAGHGRVLRAGAGEPVRRHLGQTFDLVVLDLHDGLDADVLGQVHGLIRGGGALVLRMPPEGERPRRPALALHSYATETVGTRFFERFERLLAASPALTVAARLAPPPPFVPIGTDEQRAVVQRLADAFAKSMPARLALVADRGRGKSAALGLALLEAGTRASLRVALAAPTREAAAEVMRFVGDAATNLTFVPPLELAAHGDFDVIVVDEAAQLSVPLLRALVSRHPRACFAFATTTHGYEGTGRGFVLRFLEWLETSSLSGAGGVPFELLTLEEPIRWAKDDPLERFVFDVLALDAEPSVVEPEVGDSPVPPVVLDRDALARDEPLLRSLFGLLLHAHYRTTPGDLERLLDAPNLAVHAAVDAGAVIAATLVAREGGFSREDCEALTRGRFRLRGHALADTLLTHSARPEAGELAIVRSVRIATHPALRSRGLARSLVDHVHASYDADLFGTLFGATAELVRFRRSVGYAVARVGASRGARSGEPGVVMLRPVSARGEALLTECRRDLARDLPLQRALLERDGELPLAPELLEELRRDLSPAADLSEMELETRIDRYLGGPQTFEAAAYAVTRFVREHRDLLTLTSERTRLLLDGRVLDQRSWTEVAARAHLPNVAAAMRALRPAVAELRRVRDSRLSPVP